MGFHVNEKLLDDPAYRAAATRELKAFITFVGDMAKGANVTDEKLQAFFDLNFGKADSVSYQEKGKEKTLTMKALRADKIDTGEMNRGEIVGTFMEIAGSLSEINEKLNAYTEQAWEKTGFDLNFPTVHGNLFAPGRSVDMMTHFSAEEIAENQRQIEENDFGAVSAEGAPARGKMTLKENLLGILGARKPEDFLDCIPDKATVDTCLHYYEHSEDTVHLNDANYAVGRVICEARNGKDVDAKNVKAVLETVKEKHNEYKNVGWLRRVWSYVNPAKDAVRDMRNELNEAKNFLAEKNVDKRQLDAYLDGKRDTVDVPETGPYREALKGATETLGQIRAAAEKADYRGFDHIKVEGARLEKLLDHEGGVTAPAEDAGIERRAVDDEVKKTLEDGEPEKGEFIEKDAPAPERDKEMNV